MRKGFSLIEVITAVSAFTVLSSFAFTLLKADLQLLKRSQDNMAHVFDIEAVIERQKSTAFTDLKSDAATTVTEIGPDLKAVEVKMYGLELFTLRSRY